MPKPPHELHLDFETFCELDLKKVGIHRYVEHASFKVLCVAWKLDEHAVQSMIVLRAQPARRELVDHLQNRDVQGHAHNAAFETAVLTRLGIFPVIPLSCTMQRALAYGLPGKLEAACAALGLAHQKDMTGYRLMRQMSRPLKPGSKTVWEAADYERLAAYCRKDVEAEAALSACIPELSTEEWALSELDAAMNTDGELGIDFGRVSTLRAAAAAAELEDAARCAELTDGAVTSPGTQTARLLAWLDVARPDARGRRRAPPSTRRWRSRTNTRPRSSRCCRSGCGRRGPRRRSWHGCWIWATRPAPLSVASSSSSAPVAPEDGRVAGFKCRTLPRVPKGFDPELFYEMASPTALSEGAGALNAVATASGAGLRQLVSTVLPAGYRPAAGAVVVSTSARSKRGSWRGWPGSRMFSTCSRRGRTSTSGRHGSSAQAIANSEKF